MNIICLSAGRYHSIVYAGNQTATTPQLLPFKDVYHTDASVYVFGYGMDGCLGLDDKEHRKTPTVLKFFNSRRVISVVAARQHSVVLTDTGLYTFGVGSMGNTTTPVHRPYPMYSPTLVLGLPQNVKGVAVGGYHTLIWTVHSVFGFGSNSNHQLDACFEGVTEEQEQQTTPHSVRDVRLINFFSDKTVRSAAAGRTHSLVLCDEGLYSFGLGPHGELGLGPDVKLATQPKHVDFFDGIAIYGVYCGCFTSFVLTENGLYGFGCGKYGKLGISPTNVLDLNDMYNVSNYEVGSKTTSVEVNTFHPTPVAEVNEWLMPPPPPPREPTPSEKGEDDETTTNTHTSPPPTTKSRR
eukprot:TRINITY_DN61335_c0_g1_i2.p1 TRINITY_DN61335_c0_g1~~TRINITY_DN61335_c0_g1_i2.p1  ORF type:complete len:352 (-),score=43.61 TRINITY_DN61335_c0_g1_i2:967-2022(-)